MLIGKPQMFHNGVKVLVGSLLILSLGSCSLWKTVKNYPNKPFVYETNINLESNLSKDDRAVLLSQLRSQLDDSIKNRTVSWPLWEVLNRPPVYDSTAAERSVTFMRNLLHARGYLRDSISYDTLLELKDDDPPQYRTTVNFTVRPGKAFLLDSIAYSISHPELYGLTMDIMKDSYLKSGAPFSTQTISLERERLVNHFRNNGYLKFTVDELVGIWDTLDVSLLVPATDPLEQILQLQAIQRRIDSPTANLEIRLKPGLDTARLVKFYVGNTTIYPDRGPDTAGIIPTVLVYDSNYTIIYHRNLFKAKFLAQNIYFKRGDLYNQQKFLNTITRFNTMGAWRLVNIEQIPRTGTDTVDFSVVLTPTEKYSFIANIEGSRNSGYVLQEALLGVGASVQWINRNFGRSSNQTNTNVRFGTEIAPKAQFVQSRQFSVGHTILFPKPIPNAKWIGPSLRENFRTIFSFSAANLDRKDFFNLTSVNASWGYDFTWKNKGLTIKVPNIEYSLLDKEDSLIKFLLDNPSLRGVFNDNGLVFSMQTSFHVRGGRGNASHIFRLNTEASGILIDFINAKILDSLFRFVKLDLEFVRSVQLGKKTFVYRAFAGVGVALKTRTKTDYADINLPFFKQYYAGGPNSMRGWGIRTLGPGSTLRENRDDNFKFGDIQFETNLELRFPLTTIAGVKVHSAVFTDIGNVWFLKAKPDFPRGTFKFNKFINDLAVGMGTGLRVDFSFFLLRLDYGLKIRNPSPYVENAYSQNKWFSNFEPFAGIVQLGINYPFNY